MRNKRFLWTGLALTVAGVLVLGVATAPGAAATWPWTYGRGMMGGYGPGSGFGPGMMGGGFGGMMRGHGAGPGFGGGMMGWWLNWAPQPGRQPITVEQAREAVERYLERIGEKRFAIAELWSFTDGPYYAAIEESGAGRGAFELLVDRYTGGVFPEPGPNMMWNLRYGMAAHMAGFGRPPAGEEARIPRQEAVRRAQAFLDEVRPGAGVGDGGHEFYGYWTLHFQQDGKLAGMLSVNAATGAVWLHTWHATPAAVVEGKHD